MTIVVDASVAVRWLFELPGAEQADKLLLSGDRLIAPDLVFSEVTNAAWKFAQSNEATREAATMAVGRCADFFHEIVPSAALKDIAIEIAIELNHPAYDCFYLALAEQRDCRIVTADERLLRRCERTRYSKRVGSLLNAP